MLGGQSGMKSAIEPRMLEDEDKRFGIQSVEVAARILMEMAAIGRPFQLKELASRLGWSPAKVHRYLVSLTRTGLVDQMPGVGRYAIGQAAIALGLAGLRSLDTVEVVSGMLVGLRSEIESTILLSTWTEAGPVIIRQIESTQPIYMNIRVGTILPLTRSATGQVFAAYLPEPMLRPLLKREVASLDGFNRAEWTECLETVRRNKIAVLGPPGLVPSVNAMAIPIFDHTGALALVAGILDQPHALSTDPQSPVGRRMVAFGEDASRRLGGVVADS